MGWWSWLSKYEDWQYDDEVHLKDVVVVFKLFVKIKNMVLDDDRYNDKANNELGILRNKVVLSTYEVFCERCWLTYDLLLIS